MSIEWTHAYCLTCDKQTDGTTYCSESCRLAEYEQSSPSTGPSSPAFNSPTYPWAYSSSGPYSTSASPSNRFHLAPAYHFSTHQSSSSQQRRGPAVAPPPPQQKALSPSSSHASLSSMKSSSSTASEASQQLSDAAKRELLAYASCFENARSSRRQSTH